MKILFLSYSFSPNVGGIERHSMILATALIKAAYQVRVLTSTPSTTIDDYPFELLRKPNFRQLFQCYVWADLVFENNPVLTLSLPNLFFRRPHITSLHTWIYHNGQLSYKARLKQWWLKRVDLVLAVSEALRKNTFPEAYVIPNPYNDLLFKELVDVPKTKQFVFLGRLVSDKGLAIALEALKILLQSSKLSDTEKQNIELSVIGDGPEKQQLIKQAAELNISEYVDFVGTLRGEKLVHTLNQHQIIVVPSTWDEPFGMVALEGMACACIPIVAKVGGLPEAVGEAGLLFERNNPKALAEQIQLILQNESLQKTLRAKGREHLTKHTMDYISKQYITYIERFAKIDTKYTVK